MPIGRREAFSIQLLQILDAGLVWMAFYLADLLRSPIRGLLGWKEVNVGGLFEMSWVLYLAVPFTPLVLEFLRFYRRVRTKPVVTSLSQLFKGLLIMSLIFGLVAMFGKFPEGSRLVLGTGAGFVVVLLFARDRILTEYLKNSRVREDAKERVVIAGAPADADRFLGELDPYIRSEIRLVGRFDIEHEPVSELYELLKTQAVERVIFVAGDSGFAKVASCVEACEMQGVEAWIAASFMRSQIARPTFDLLGDRPMLVLRSTPELSWELAMKEVFDRLGALTIILATSPLWIFAWLGIRISSPGAPAFYCQMRAGKYGRPFRMWKFRTMVPDADKLLDQIKAEHGNQMDGPVFKLDHDPRIFPFGSLLRKLSIDELPQLLNVLIGDMSLVGPRPLPLYEVEAFEKSEHRRRLSVKPGITCEWQAGGRNKITSFEQWVAMDLHYIDNWSFWLDVKLLLKTVPAVLFGRGAK